MKARAVVLIVLANVLGGLSYLGQKQALAGLPPVTVTLLRNVIALLALVAWMRIAGANLAGWTRSDHRRGALLGTVAYGLPMALGIVGVQHSTAANGSILILLEPCAILVLCWLLLKERLGPGQIGGVLLGLAGALCIVLEGAGTSGLANLWKSEYARGNAILAAHGILWGLYTPVSKSLAERRGPLELTFVSMAWSLLVLVPWSATEIRQLHVGPELLPALTWTLALGLVISVGSTMMWLAALRYLPASSIAPFVFLQPVAGVLGGWLWLGERISAAVLLGGALIASGVLLTLVYPARRERPTAAEA